jgi:hypothetical protein
MPWRSTVYSLASGDWTDPDISIDDQIKTADSVIGAVNSIVDTLTESRPAALTPGDHCRWCPARTTCPSGPTAVEITMPASVGE